MELKLFFVLWMVSTAEQAELITAQGRIRGEMHQGYVSYNGIPYASGNDTTGRFKQAGIPPTWSGMRESQQPRCGLTSRVNDCLQLDVHVPTSGASWPVLVWVKGGGGRYSPGKLVQQGIVVVVVSHRIGPLGFLCLGEEKMPGNVGVKDVVMALRWVRDNIPAFNGNPYKVVVAGQGFGAAMVEALLLSPMTQDLFHGAIMQSGSVLCPWAFNHDAKDRGLSLLQMLIENDETTSLLNAGAEDLAVNADKIYFPYLPFGICVEKGFKNEERMLPESPYRLLSNKLARKVPLIMGYNTDEAYIFLSALRENNIRKKMARDVSVLLPEELKFLNVNELKTVAKQIKELYFKNNSTMAALLAYHRDAYFLAHIHRSARLHAASDLPVYYYQFSYAGQPGVVADHQLRKAGAAHSDELAYLFPETTSSMEGTDGTVQDNILRLWTNFVKHLNPTPSDASPRWDPLDSAEPRVLDIGAELTMQPFPYTRACRMWDDIYERFYYSRNYLGL
ncbi:acetylcholinesterase-like [Ostrinia furnacalis]|uniref:acetylcholinesterase-like n=1 Tax=Ostrinia furnacalis TaxID=93504 RepID=UPI001040B5E3|nr:acetylcholinesterase-like [Ostrinia furnacalis]